MRTSKSMLLTWLLAVVCLATATADQSLQIRWRLRYPVGAMSYAIREVREDKGWKAVTFSGTGGMRLPPKSGHLEAEFGAVLQVTPPTQPMPFAYLPPDAIRVDFDSTSLPSQEIELLRTIVLDTMADYFLNSPDHQLPTRLRIRFAQRGEQREAMLEPEGWQSVIVTVVPETEPLVTMQGTIGLVMLTPDPDEPSPSAGLLRRYSVDGLHLGVPPGECGGRDGVEFDDSGTMATQLRGDALEVDGRILGRTGYPHSVLAARLAGEGWTEKSSQDAYSSYSLGGLQLLVLWENGKASDFVLVAKLKPIGPVQSFDPAGPELTVRGLRVGQLVPTQLPPGVEVDSVDGRVVRVTGDQIEQGDRVLLEQPRMRGLAWEHWLRHFFDDRLVLDNPQLEGELDFVDLRLSVRFDQSTGKTLYTLYEAFP